jgi:nucleoredoxin
MSKAAEILGEAFASHGVIEKDGDGIRPVSRASIEGKIVGLYFSAHWCPPCRRLTPLLGEKYKELVAAGQNLEIIFVSADRSEKDALGYFAEQPWKMLSFDQEDANGALNDLFEVNGIPHLVLLDENLELITQEGIELIMTIQDFSRIKHFEEDKQARMKDASALLTPIVDNGLILETQGDQLQAVSKASLQGKMLGLYFSAHWCPPCQQFTPLLAAKYTELVAAGRPFDIVFVSSDRSEAEALGYYKTHPWKMLKYDGEDERRALGEHFNVEGIPSLVLVDENFQLVSLNGRKVVMSVEFERWRTFDEDERRKAEELARILPTLPATVTIAGHPHPLKKLPSVYRGSYGCDMCKSGGSGWVYHCDECGFDAHPQCACPDAFPH